MKGYTHIVLVFFFAQCTLSLANICPDGWSGLLPNPEDCGKFYQCSHGYPYSFNCYGDLHFNPNLLVCDWPQDAGCVVSSTTSSTAAPSPSTTAAPPSTTTPSPSTTAPPPSTTAPSPSTTTAQPPSTTAPPPSTTAPSPSTTTAQPSPFPPSPTAPPGTEAPTTEPPTSQEEEESTETTYFPETTVAELFPTTLPPELEGSGEEWEASGDEETLVRCPARNPGADIFLPDPRDCNGFYYCSWGVAVAQHCPSGLHWSVRSSVCTSPSEASCNF